MNTKNSIQKLRSLAWTMQGAGSEAAFAAAKLRFMRTLRSIPSKYYKETSFSLQEGEDNILYSEPRFTEGRSVLPVWTATVQDGDGKETTGTKKPVSRTFWVEAARNLSSEAELSYRAEKEARKTELEAYERLKAIESLSVWKQNMEERP